MGDHLKSLGSKGLSIEFAYNWPTNLRTNFSPFFIVYGNNPRALLNLAHVLNLKRVNAKAKDRITHILEVHKANVKNLQDCVAKYKASADKKWRYVKFEE